VNKALIIICIVLKITLIIAFSITLIRKDEIDLLKAELLCPEKGEEGNIRASNKLADNIWED
jgi:hypothetical protein